jgi:hypothetical protein
MTIDLSEWNEYIADDIAPGPIPSGVELEIMRIDTNDGFKEVSKDGSPTGVMARPNTWNGRIFWRLKK